MNLLNYPRVSIITPTFNQGRFIEETINSVLSQDYPNIEYIVLDAGSTDGTADILKKYKKTKNFIWVSERDRGQADAINKGLRMATGEIVGYINSDDYYFPHAITRVIRTFQSNQDTLWMTGDYKIVDKRGKEIQMLVSSYKKLLRTLRIPLSFSNSIIQPSTFWKRSIHRTVGYFDSTLHFAFDYDFWLRLGNIVPPKIVSDKLSAFRIHRASKGTKGYELQFAEDTDVVSRYEHSPIVLQLHKIHNSFITRVYHTIK
jgi:glycosyltransferase involved in cell wall biosynthesis